MLCEKKICYDDLDLTMNPIPFLLESTLGFDVSKIYGGFAVKPSLRLHCILFRQPDEASHFHEASHFKISKKKKMMKDFKIKDHRMMCNSRM